jgi:hypothetical protein
MLFTGYIDESDTHGKRPDMTMAGMLSTAGRWERCDREYAALRKRLGFTVFHGSDFHNQGGEFADWGPETCWDCLMSMGKLVATHVVECFTVHCPYDVYEKYFLRKKPRKMRSIGQFGICFMGVLDGMTRNILDHGQGTNHKLSLIVEDGHRNATGSAVEFKARQDQLNGVGSSLLLSHALARKKDVPLLQLADVTAFGHTLEQRAIKRGEALPFGERGEPPPVYRLQTGWTISEISPEYLALVIEEFEAGRAAVHDDYLRRRQAWLASKVA